MRGVGRQEPRLEALSLVDGRPGHALGERVLAAFPGRLGARHEEIRTPVAAAEAECGAEQGVVLAPTGGRLCELPAQEALASRVDA